MTNHYKLSSIDYFFIVSDELSEATAGPSKYTLYTQ